MAKISLYLDSRVKNKEGLCPLKIVIRNRSSIAYYSTGIVLPESCWKNGKVVGGKDLLKIGKSPLMLNRQIKNLYDRFELAFQDIVGLKTNLPAKKILSLVAKQIIGDTEESNTTMRQLFAEKHNDSGLSASSRKLYHTTLRALEKYYPKLLGLHPNEIDRKTINTLFERFKEAGLKDSTVRTYLIKLCSVYNLAISKRLCPRQDNDDAPFKKQKWLRMPLTVRRNITIEEFRKLWNLTLIPKQFKTPKTYGNAIKALQVFKLLFCLCGINVADLYRLTDKDILNGRVETRRQKTGMRISVKLEPEALALIKSLRLGNKLIGRATTGRTPALYRVHLNKLLQLIHPGLTSYYARHTWATLAFDLDVPDNVIAMGLSHSYKSNAMNAIYINNDYRKLDKANRRILDYVEGKIEID